MLRPITADPSAVSIPGPGAGPRPGASPRAGPSTLPRGVAVHERLDSTRRRRRREMRRAEPDEVGPRRRCRRPAEKNFPSLSGFWLLVSRRIPLRPWAAHEGLRHRREWLHRFSRRQDHSSRRDTRCAASCARPARPTRIDRAEGDAAGDTWERAVGDVRDAASVRGRLRWLRRHPAPRVAVVVERHRLAAHGRGRGGRHAQRARGGEDQAGRARGVRVVDPRDQRLGRGQDLRRGVSSPFTLDTRQAHLLALEDRGRERSAPRRTRPACR